MSNTSLPDPYGRITTHTITGQQFFYRWPESPYLDNAKECIEVVTYSDMRQYAAAVSAADNAALREHLGNLLAVLHGDGGHYEAEHGTDKAVADALTRFYSNIMAADSKITAKDARIKVLEDALRKAIVQNEHDMLMTGEELRAASAALGDKNE